MLVLASGFRNFIVFLIIYWYSFYHLDKRKIVNLKVLKIVVGIFLVFYAFQYYRTDGLVGAHLIDILNRNAPLAQSFVSDLNSDIFVPHLILFNYGLPLATIFSKLGGYDFQNWNEVIVNEAVFRDYLIWRGTGLFRPTGFATNYLIYGYMVAGYMGLLVASISYIFVLLIAFLFLRSFSFGIFGLIIISVVFMGVVDSAVEAYVLMQFMLFYYSALFLMSRVIMKIRSALYQAVPERLRN
tara:strand:+ start:82 stop:804 length:723 start_codon:yes stop_codon:yes gene_type:complete